MKMENEIKRKKTAGESQKRRKDRKRNRDRQTERESIREI